MPAPARHACLILLAPTLELLAYETSPALQAAEAAWADARAAGVQPDLILYSAMIDACAKVGCGLGWRRQ